MVHGYKSTILVLCFLIALGNVMVDAQFFPFGKFYCDFFHANYITYRLGWVDNITFNPTNTNMPCISDKFLNDDAKEGASGLSEDLGSEEGSLHALNKLILQK